MRVYSISTVRTIVCSRTKALAKNSPQANRWRRNRSRRSFKTAIISRRSHVHTDEIIDGKSSLYLQACCYTSSAVHRMVSRTTISTRRDGYCCRLLLLRLELLATRAFLSHLAGRSLSRGGYCLVRCSRWSSRLGVMVTTRPFWPRWRLARIFAQRRTRRKNAATVGRMVISYTGDRKPSNGCSARIKTRTFSTRTELFTFLLSHNRNFPSYCKRFLTDLLAISITEKNHGKLALERFKRLQLSLLREPR